jgi:hypothetical protein
MKKYFQSINRKSLVVTVLVSAFILTTSVAFAAMTLNTDTISTTGVLNLNPTGQPVTVNGNLTVTGASQGVLQDKGGEIYNVKAYGAVGDGTTDDYTAVMAAISAAQNANGGTIYFPRKFSLRGAGTIRN